MATYSKKSPYNGVDQSRGYLDIADIKDIPALSNDVQWEVTPQYKHRPDLLAHDLYQDAGFWRVFASRNKDILRDPVYDLIPGQRIFIPQTTTLKKVLGL